MKLLTHKNKEFRDVISLAMADELLVFVGAGCSIEAGLPDWKALAVRYINQAVDEADLPQDLPRRFGDPRRLAIIADAMLGDFKRFGALSHALYPAQAAPSPGPTAKEIAKLYRARLRAGLKTYIVTTNFDPLIEMALDEFVKEPLCLEADSEIVGAARSVGLADRFPDTVESSTSAQEGAEKIETARDLFRSDSEVHTPVVLHLHGAIDLRDPNHPNGIDPLFLSERDYARWERLAQQALLELLTDTRCLMVGLSLEDNDVINVLYRHMSGDEKIGVPPELSRERIVVAFNPVHGMEDDGPVAEEVVTQVRRLENRRLEELGVKRLRHLKNFAQIPQVLHEMGVAVELAHADGSEPLTDKPYLDSENQYEQRLERWKADFKEHCLSEANFDEQQLRASGRCDEVLTQVVEAINDSIGQPVDDELAIHIWVRSEIETDGPWMFPWCCNEFARRGRMPDSLSRRIVHSETDIALLQAFKGVPSRRLHHAADHSRWKQILAAPVISRTTDVSHPYGRILIGVVTLSTNRTAKDSDLSSGIQEHNDLLPKIIAELQSLGRELLVEMSS